MYTTADVKEFLIEVEQCMCDGVPDVTVGDNGQG